MGSGVRARMVRVVGYGELVAVDFDCWGEGGFGNEFKGDWWVYSSFVKANHPPLTSGGSPNTYEGRLAGFDVFRIHV
jgi:hypothetical protein